MTSDLNEKFFHEQARIAAIYPLNGIGDPENPPEWLEEFCEDIDGSAGHIFKQFPELVRFTSFDRTPPDYHVAEAMVLTLRSGYLVKVEHAIRLPWNDTYSFSWGYYRHLWVYVEAFDDIVAKVLEAVEASHAKEAAKATAS